MKLVYVADDGNQFETEDECFQYESGTTLEGHIKAFCPETWLDDYGFSVIEPDNVADYIVRHIEKINEFVKALNVR